jgi:hypothetical protein
MLVEVTGRYTDGAWLKAVWTLIAESGDGPVIPSLPALCVVKSLLAGRMAIRGAMPCVGVIDLATIEGELKRFDIRTERETIALERAPLFARVLADFDRMPAAVRAAHSPDPAADLEGRVDIDGAENWFGRAVAWLAGFPRGSADAPALVTIEREGDGEIWLRRFGTAEFSSRLSAGSGADRLVERFGPFAFDLEARADDAGFELAIRGARLFGVPLPRVIAPSTRANASADESGRYRFDVTITLPLIGRLVRYRGWLAPTTSNLTP